MSRRNFCFALLSICAAATLGGCGGDTAACELTDLYETCPNVDVEGGECVGFSEQCAQCFLDSDKDVCTDTVEITEDCQAACSAQ